MQHLCFMRNKKSGKCNLCDSGFNIDRFVEGHDTRSTVQTVLGRWVFSCFQNQKSSLQTGNREDIFCCISCSTLLYKPIIARVWLGWMLKVNLSPVTLISQTVFLICESTCEIRHCTFSSDCSFILQEIPEYFNFSSETVHLNVASDDHHQVKDRSMRLSDNNRRSSSFKTEQTVSPGLQEASDSHGVNKYVSPVKVTSRKKTQPTISFDAVRTPAAVCPTGRHSPTVSAERTHDVAKLKSIGSSAKKIPQHDMPKSQFKQLMNKSVQSTSGLSVKKDAKISEPLPSTPHMQGKPRSMTASSTVATFQTTGLYSSSKSGKLSEKLSPKSVPRIRKCSSPPEIEQKAIHVSPSNIPVHKKKSRRALRFSALRVQNPESVELSSGSQQTEGKEGSVAPSTSTSKLTASGKKSRTLRLTQTAKSDESGSESPRRTGYKGRPFFSSTPVFKQSVSTVKTRDAGGVGSSSKFVVENLASLGLRALSGSSSEKDNEMVRSLGRRIMEVSSPRISNSFGSLSSELHGEAQNSSGSRYSESMHVPKSSGKRVQRLSRSKTSLHSLSPTTSLSAQGADMLRKRSLLKEQDPQSDAYHMYLISPSSQNMTFDFDSVETPSITLEHLVSPLTSNRKRKCSRWQDASTSEEKQDSEPVFKKRRISERISRNATSSGGRSLHSLPPHSFTSLKSSKKNLSDISGVLKLRKTPRDLRSLRNDLRNISGLKWLMKTPKSLNSPKSDVRDVRGARKHMATPKNPKSPKKDLSDVHGVRKRTTTPKSPQSPKNDLNDICGVKRLMPSPKGTKSPKNDLSDVRGVKRLLASPKVTKSPKNDLSDVRGVKRLMASPKVKKSPKNDLSDVHGVKRLVASPKDTKSPVNKVPEADVSMEMYVDQKTVPVPKDIKVNTCTLPSNEFACRSCCHFHSENFCYAWINHE